MFSRLWGTAVTLLRTKYRQYARTWWWCVFWLVVGIVFAIISLAIGNIGTGDLNLELIDGNILNMTAKHPNIGGFLWKRVASLLFPLLLVFGGALLGRGGSLIVFPVAGIHGYWLCLSVWWTFNYYSLNSVFLLAFYVGWLLLVTLILFASFLWALAFAQDCRGQQFRCRLVPNFWGRLLGGWVVVLGLGLILGAIEYLVFWVALGKIVYKPV